MSKIWWALLVKQVRTHKRNSPMDFNTLTFQCWPTSKNLYIYQLCTDFRYRLEDLAGVKNNRGLVSLSQRYINIYGFVNVKTILVEQQWYYFTNSWRNKRVHAFPKCISPKVNLMAWLKFGFGFFVLWYINLYGLFDDKAICRTAVNLFNQLLKE